MVAFPSYDYLIKRTNVQARSTVARSLAILRITRWVTLCRRVRDRSGRYRGNIYALHDEPLGLGSSFYLDPGYMAFWQDASRHHHARVRQVAAAMLQSLGECIDEGEDVLATPPLSQADQRLEALSAIRGVATSLGSGTGHCRLSDPGAGRWREDHRFTMPSRVSRTELKIQTRWRQKFYMSTEFKIRTRRYVVVVVVVDL